jgi:NTP pyrophosphatase (non-canonical NTP hydrolase)
LHHAAAIAEEVRKGKHQGDLFTEIADFALWLFTAVHKLTGRLGESKGPNETPADKFIRIQSNSSDLLWHKYPGVCPLCYARTIKDGRSLAPGTDSLLRCDCRGHHADLEDPDLRHAASITLRSLSEEIQGKKPTSINQWQQMFGAIFGASLTELSLTEIALHLMEELGETSDAMIRMYSYRQDNFIAGEPNRRQSRLEAQLADVFSWLFGLVERLNFSQRDKLDSERGPSKAVAVAAGPIWLSQIIWERYGSEELHSFWCPFCRGVRCSCQLIFVPATRPSNELLEKFQS